MSIMEELAEAKADEVVAQMKLDRCRRVRREAEDKRDTLGGLAIIQAAGRKVDQAIMAHGTASACVYRLEAKIKAASLPWYTRVWARFMGWAL